MPKRHGFTLIELMIAVAIVGILAAIASLQFGDSTRKSADALTKGNLGAIRSSLSIYYSDADGVYPEDDLSCLTTNTKYLQVIPTARLIPMHGDSTLVTPETTVTETAGWSYNNDKTLVHWGTIHVGCVHQDSRNNVWSIY